jgi:5-methyltetrahydropteroyltriglutamate--homocysteine methyltransferase
VSAITTAVVGSSPQPDWLVDQRRYRVNVVPRIRMPDLWRVPPDLLEEAQDAGVDFDRPGIAIGRLGKPTPVPRIVGPIVRERAVFLRDARFLRSVTERRIKIAVPGPFTLAQLAQDEYYKDDARLAMAYAETVNAELRELEPLVDVLQLDEPDVEPRVERARHYALPVIDRALAGITKPTCVHVCMGYAYSHALAGTTKAGGYVFAAELARSAASQVSVEAAQPRLDVATLAPPAAAKTVVLGVLDLGDPTPESAEVVASRIREALRHLPRERLVAAPDCGMKYLERATARQKLAPSSRARSASTR